jgi:hypothetical protein
VIMMMAATKRLTCLFLALLLCRCGCCGTGLSVYQKLYRDCLRLVRHIAPGTSTKSIALQNSIRQQFKSNKYVEDEQLIEQLKANAVRGLSNYMLYQSATKDTHLSNAMKQQEQRTLAKTVRDTIDNKVSGSR